MGAPLPRGADGAVLAILREPRSLADLNALLVDPLAHAQMLEAVDGLRQRSLIERGQRAGSFTLQPVVLEYVTTKLAAMASEEIQQGLLLRLLLGHLRGQDLSHLALRGAYLQEIEMQDANLPGALMRECVFREAFDALTAVAISRSRQYWAAISRRGEVQVWSVEREAGQMLHLSWQAHTDHSLALAFSPDKHMLASVSHDGSVKLWDVESSALLWSGQHAKGTICLAFSPMGASSPAGAWMRPSGSGRRNWVLSSRRCRIPVRSASRPGARMAASSPAGVMMTSSSSGRRERRQATGCSRRWWGTLKECKLWSRCMPECSNLSLGEKTISVRDYSPQ